MISGRHFADDISVGIFLLKHFRFIRISLNYIRKYLVYDNLPIYEPTMADFDGAYMYVGNWSSNSLEKLYYNYSMAMMLHQNCWSEYRYRSAVGVQM